MRHLWSGRAFGVVVLSWAGCSAAPRDELPSERELPIVYGDDDRLEVYEHPDAAWRALAQSSVVALVPRGRVQRPASGEVRLFAPALGDAYDLCPEERFLEQPVAADCTGVLIDQDLVLTAGHCFEEQSCQDYFYAFDYFYRAEGEREPLGAHDLYACRKMVVQELRVLRAGTRVDFAVVQLDRPALDRKPVPIRSPALQAGEPLGVIGTGSGLPFKIDTGASVLEPRAASTDYFTLEADTFEGSSGSGVFDADGALAGVLVRGGTDYIDDLLQGCTRVRRRERAVPGELDMGELGQEQATYVASALTALCRSGFPSERLCPGNAARCGDGFCSAGETRDACAQDCQACDAEECAPAVQDRAALRGAEASPQGSKRRAPSCALASGSGAPSVWWAASLLGAVALLARRLSRRSL